MSAEATIRMLQAGATTTDAAEWRRQAARATWVMETVAALREAQQKVTDAWDRMLGALPDDITDEELEALSLPDPPEQAELDALWAAINAVIERDLWPRHLYFGGI